MSDAVTKRKTSRRCGESNTGLSARNPFTIITELSLLLSLTLCDKKTENPQSEIYYEEESKSNLNMRQKMRCIGGYAVSQRSFFLAESRH
jgi:hypothetical protein